jgi:hypothetical protein
MALPREHGDGDVVEDPRATEGLPGAVRLRNGRPGIRPPVFSVTGDHYYFFFL